MEIDINNLTLSDANSDFVRVQWFKKDVLTTKDYTLKVSTALEVSKVYEELSKIKIQELHIEKVNHSKMDDLKKEVKTTAIRSAKDKATYLLSAIGYQIGKPLSIIENNRNIISAPLRYEELMIRGSRSDATSYYVDGVKMKENNLADVVTFSKIKLEYQITARFEIK